MENNYFSHIDTIQTKESLENRAIQDLSTRGSSSYIKGSNIITKYNTNNCSSTYKLNGSVNETENILNNMMAALTVINTDNVNYSRVDVATDVSAPFASISKFLDFIHRCMIATLDGTLKRITDTTTEEVESYVFKSNMLEVEFYDKHKESNGVAPYPTRLEIRFLRRKTKDLKLHINNAIKLWREVPANVEEAEGTVIEMLKLLYKEELKSNKIANFNDFVCRYQERIFTRHILEELYKYAGSNGSFKKWLDMYRETYNLIFYTKTDVKTFSKDIIKSLKNYIKK